MIEPTRPQLDAAARTLALLIAPVRLHLVWLATNGEHDARDPRAATMTIGHGPDADALKAFDAESFGPVDDAGSVQIL